MSILDEIIETKRAEVAKHKAITPLASLQALIDEDNRPRAFVEALRHRDGCNIIAECKAKSPSEGTIASDYDPASQATAYERGGAAAVSVLTDSSYFGGKLEDLRLVREQISLPVMRKDFIIDEYQIYEARRFGADSFLLLAGTLDLAQLQYFIEIGRELGMEPLVESHSEEDLAVALASDAKILGINNRNLATMSVDFETSLTQGERIRKLDPQRVLVCESGIKTRFDVERARTAGYSCFLIGTQLMRAEDPAAQLMELRGVK